MNIEEAREFCLSFKNATECLPFGDIALVFKVENKMFALIPLDVEEPSISLKCDHEKVEELRDKYNAVIGASHFNKKYWNKIYLKRDMKDEEIKHWINHSYREVIAKLPKKIRDLYNENELCR